MTNKRVEYEILLSGKESVSSIAQKVASAVTQGQKAASSAIQKVNSTLESQGSVAVAVASKGKAALDVVAASQQKANKSLASSYTKAYEGVKNSLESGAHSVEHFNGLMENQKKVIADMTARYQQMKASKGDTGKSARFLQELNEEKGALAGMRDAVNQYKQSNGSLRGQIAAVRNEMAKMRLEGKENTAEYAERRQELERLGTTYRELLVEQKALSSGSAQIGGVINGVQGLMGLYSAGSGVLGLYVRDNEKLMQVQTKMQSVMAIMMGVQQVANTLHSTSAFRMVTCRKVAELWSAAQNRLTVSIGMTTAAAKASMAAMTMGASIIITAVITAISKLIAKKQEQRRQEEEARKAEEAAQESVRASVANSVAAQLVSYRKLQAGWKALNGDAQKQRKFIKDNATEFKNLGVQVNSVKDAENVLVSNEDAFVQSLKRRAMAAAAMELASKKYQSAIEKMLQAEEAKKVTEEDRKAASTYANDVYNGKVAAAGSNPLARGQVAGQRKQIVNEAYQSNIHTYGEARAKEYNDAAEKEIKEGDHFFDIVKKYNDLADQQLSGRGITPASGGADAGSGAMAGSIDAIEKRIQALTARMKSAGATERAELQKDINAWQKKLDAVNLELEALSVPADPQTIQELETAITYYGKLLKVAGADERAEIQQTIDGYTKKKTAIEDGLKALSVPVNPKTLEEFSAVLSDLERKLQTASGAEQSNIQAAINAYQREEDEMRARIALAATPEPLDSLADYEQAISACEAVLQYANEEERANIQKTINEYRRKKEAIEDSLASLDVPSDPKSLEDIGKVISALETKLQKAGDSERADIQKQITLWNAKKDAIEQSLQLVGMDDLASMVQGGLGVGEEMELTLRARITGAEIAKQKIRELQQMAAVAQTDEEKASIKSAIKQWQQYAVQFNATGSAGQKATGVLENMAAVANNMSGIVGEGAAGWLTWGSNVLSAVAQALPAIASVIGGNIAQAFAGAAAQSQTVAFPWNLVALGASFAAVAAAVASIPKYAEGGLAYGPTIGMFGEYSGAASNPEVVAPLDRLKSLIGVDRGGGTVEFRIEGRTLVGILKKESKRNERTS